MILSKFSEDIIIMKKIIIGALLLCSSNIFAIGGNSIPVTDELGLSGYGVVIIREKIGVEVSDEVHCSGTLLNSSFVLTAAHCFENEWKYRYYAVKTNNYRALKHQRPPSENEDARILNLQNSYFPETYVPELGYGDFAIVQIEGGYEGIGPIKMLDKEEDLSKFGIFYIAGFSKSDLQERDYGVFRYVSMNFNYEKTTEFAKSKNLIFLSSDINEGTAYDADSGGGIFVKKDSQFYLIGSLVRSASKTNNSGVFGIDVREFSDIVNNAN